MHQKWPPWRTRTRQNQFFGGGGVGGIELLLTQAKKP